MFDKTKIKLSLNLFLLILSASFCYLNKNCFAVNNNAANTVDPLTQGLGYLAAGIVTGLSTVGAGIATGSAAAAALGAVSENGKFMGKALIFVALAEGIAIYGLLISFTILGRI